MATLTYGIRGMTCGACARHVESALAAVPGVRSVHVDLVQAIAMVETDRAIQLGQMRGALATGGYALTPRSAQYAWDREKTKSLLVGVLAAGTLVGLYLGLIALAQGWNHALDQLQIDLGFVAALTAGFGTQVGLFAYLRSLQARMAGSGVGMAASTVTSTGAMLACCAHHVTDVLPILGIGGLAVFLGAYRTPLLWIGLSMNVAGITFLVFQLRRYRATVDVSGGSACSLERSVPGLERALQ